MEAATTITFDDDREVDVIIEGTYTPGTQDTYYAPGDPAEVEVLSVRADDGNGQPTGPELDLTPAQQQRCEDALVAAWERGCHAAYLDAAEARADAREDR